MGDVWEPVAYEWAVDPNQAKKDLYITNKANHVSIQIPDAKKHEVLRSSSHCQMQTSILIPKDFC